MHEIYGQPLPPNWDEQPLGTLVETKRGLTWSKDQERGTPNGQTIPVVRIPNVQESLDMTDTLHLEGVTSEQRVQSAVTKGWSLMVGSNGNPKRIGDSVLIDQDWEMVFASFLFGLRPRCDTAKVTDEYLACWLKLHRVHEFVSETSQMTTGLANISWSACRRLPVRFPSSKDAQSRIAEVLTAADDHIRALNEQLRRAERVKKSLLQTVFVRGLPSTETQFMATRIGEVPSQWTVCTIRRVLVEPPFNGVSPESRPNPPGTPILNVGCIRDGRCTLDAISYVDVDEPTIRECEARRGDFSYSAATAIACTWQLADGCETIRRRIAFFPISSSACVSITNVSPTVSFHTFGNHVHFSTDCNRRRSLAADYG